MKRRDTRRPHRRAGAATCALLVVIALSACTEELPEDPMHIVVLELNQSTFSLADFQAYLSTNLLRLETERTIEDPDAHLVKSRLFDIWVEEQLLLHEARSRGIAIRPDEVESELVLDDDGAQAISAARRAMVANRLRLTRLEEAIAADLEPITEADVSAHLAAQLGEGAGAKRVRFRSVRFERRKDAERAHAAIRRGRNTLDEILVQYALPPDQGLPVELALESLPPELRAALENLRRGRVSQPTEVNGAIYLFQVESWLDGPREPTALERSQARALLLTQRRQDAYDALLDRLRRETKVEIHSAALPFRYVAPSA